ETAADGSVSLPIRAQDGIDPGSLRVLPTTASGIRTLGVTPHSGAREERTKFDDSAWVRLELAFGFGAQAPESCSATSTTGFKPSTALKQSITEAHPLPVGGTLRVDREGVCTWQGRAIRLFKERPPWRQTDSEPE